MSATESIMLHRYVVALHMIQDRDRGVLVAYHIRQTPIKNIAKDLGISVERTRQLLKRAERRLDRLINNPSPEEEINKALGL